ncbi:MAG: type II toxin-antitoxin system HipA family toxin YjjJ [Sideroxydans sp.]|nr:type II toxin-antitoxin system HipA family toxin YjjJ [Sideroxydans sp.]
MAATDTLVQILRSGAQPARALYEQLGISQPTLSRMVSQLGESILKFGKARQTQYALRRAIGAHGSFPLYRVSAAGELQQWGVLHPIFPQGYLVEISGHEVRTEVCAGLPWYLQDMRPQGFLGRAYARFNAPLLGLPVDPNRWNDDQTLLALAHNGHDTPGNLLVGEESASQFQTRALFSTQQGELLPVPAAQRPQEYPRLARMALAGEVVGSSAGGEQPKFNIAILRDGQPVNVMVKFSAPQDNAATRRWRSLLICEHLAFQVLKNNFPCSASELLEADDATQLFLQVPRFDRVGMRGRLGVVSLKALDDEFAGLAADWVKIAAALVKAGKLSEAVYQEIQRRYAFGVLIGNSDMHPGNLSFFVDDVTRPQAEYTLTPVYDMLPMSLAPRPSGQIPDALPPLKIGVNPPLEVWKEMLPLAIQYWRQVAGHAGVAKDVKQMAREQAGILSGSLS